MNEPADLPRLHGRRVSVHLAAEVCALPPSRDPFACFLAWRAGRADAAEIARTTEDLLERGAAYFCCWGDDCERVHDGIDGVLIERGTKPGEILTTWHVDETLAEAIESALLTAYPPVGDDVPVRLVCVGEEMRDAVKRAIAEVR